MRTAIALVFGLSWACAITSYAQQELVGTYKGEYWERGAYVHPHIQKVTLRISSPESGKVIGKLELGEDLCRGVYDIQGTYQDGQLALRTSEGPVVGCAQQITLTNKDNKLTGNMSAESPGRPGIELIKQQSETDSACGFKNPDKDWFWRHGSGDGKLSAHRREHYAVIVQTKQP